MSCMSAKPPLNLDEWMALVERCATSYGGADWPSLALTGAATLVVLVAAVLLVGAVVGRLR